MEWAPPRESCHSGIVSEDAPDIAVVEVGNMAVPATSAASSSEVAHLSELVVQLDHPTST